MKIATIRNNHFHTCVKDQAGYQKKIDAANKQASQLQTQLKQQKDSAQRSMRWSQQKLEKVGWGILTKDLDEKTDVILADEKKNAKEITMDRDDWKASAEGMYTQYKDLYKKNLKFAPKVDQMMQAGTFGQKSKKDRRNRGELTGSPLEDLPEYQEC
ncbi:hypothetical protein N0V90_003035 [Kalmusia sp. IMI 367209]|nr:hypothetical protein N0V90_003035 [Kalmusia sp. IMI 367209]